MLNVSKKRYHTLLDASASPSLNSSLSAGLPCRGRGSSSSESRSADSKGDCSFSRSRDPPRLEVPLVDSGVLGRLVSIVSYSDGGSFDKLKLLRELDRSWAIEWQDCLRVFFLSLCIWCIFDHKPQC